MKKIFFVLCICIFCQSFSFAQYLDTTSHWHETYNRNFAMIADLDYGTAITDYTVKGDTIMNGQSFHQIWKDWVSDMYFLNGYDTLGTPIFDYVHDELHGLHGYLREVGKKWYFRYSATANEQLLYDFDMKTDSLLSNYGTYLGGDCLMAMPVITGVGHFCLGNIPRESFGIWADGSYQVANNILEGIGSQAGLMGRVCNDGEPESDFSMVFTQGGNTVSWNATCWTGIEENTVSSAFTLYPNPSSESVWIASVHNIQTLQIYNMQGVKIKELMPDTQLFSLSISDFLPGVYLVVLNNGVAVQKLMKD